jgi:cytolysin-activating lysine-acyltransferase
LRIFSLSDQGKALTGPSAATGANSGAANGTNRGGAAGGDPAGDTPPGANPAGSNPFSQPVPAGAARTVSQVLGEITWLMSQSKAHKSFFISDLEWLVMVPVLMQQFRMFYDTGTPAEAGKPAVEGKPIGVVLWASVNDAVAARLAEGGGRMGPADWKSGEHLWVVEVISPFGGAEAMVADLKEKIFPTREIKMLVRDGGTGERGVRAV